MRKLVLHDKGLAFAEQTECQQIGIVKSVGEPDCGAEVRRGARDVARTDRQQTADDFAIPPVVIPSGSDAVKEVTKCVQFCKKALGK